MSTQKSANNPLIAITMGDPAGIGPEIAIKALTSENPRPDSRIFIIGDLSVLEQTAGQIIPPVSLYKMETIEDIRENCINIFDMKQINPGDYTIGEISSNCGKAAFNYILKGIDLAIKGIVNAVVTCPINKASLNKAGIPFPGHTEIFAHETKTENYSMMFMLDNVCVTHVTTHCSLREAIELISQERVYKNIVLLNKTIQTLGVDKPVIAVSGLNPHAGEGGLFGDEESVHIIPAIEAAQKDDIYVTGPLPPDTVFMRAFRGEFNGIVSMLHDHGFVALKSRDFERSVNITVGLPIIRTSVGHGTAFDIAGTGKASEKSLRTAIDAAYRMCLNR
jgi:4-hydroxythreonine-4-phosphate dehydrogenase